jgi:hypothetical protein
MVESSVVKIASSLLKSYDFMSQHVYNIKNWVKNSKTSKLGQTRLNL